MKREDSNIPLDLQQFAQGLMLLSEDEVTTALLAIPMKLCIEALNDLHAALDGDEKITKEDLDAMDEANDLLHEASLTIRTVIQDHRKIGKKTEENN